MMNLYNIGDLAGEVLISGNDALTVAAPKHMTMSLRTLSGEKSSITITNADGRKIRKT